MKRIFASFVATGLLTMANAFAAETPEPVLSARPACIGTEVAPELVGTYKGQKNGHEMTISLGRGSATYVDANRQPENAKAWTCIKDGAQLLVVLKGSDRYMSRLIMLAGNYLVDLGDVRPEQNLGQAELQRLATGDEITVFKKQP